MTIPDNNNETYTLTGFNPIQNVKVGGLVIGLERTIDGDFAFSVNNSPECVLIEPDAIEDTHVVYNGNKHRIATDGTGMVRFEEGDAIAYKPVGMSGRKVYVKSRFTAMQTHITETANYTKIVDFGIARIKGWEGGKPVYKPEPEGRIEGNSEIISAIVDPDIKGIIFGPGSLFTSLIPHFLVKGLADALRERRKK